MELTSRRANLVVPGSEPKLSFGGGSARVANATSEGPGKVDVGQANVYVAPKIDREEDARTQVLGLVPDNQK